MARVSLDDASSGSSSSSAKEKSRSSSKAAAPAGGSSGGMLSKLDSKQKIKAIASICVILFAGVFIAWQLGLFGEGRVESEVNFGLSEEQVQQYNEQVQREEREQRENATRMEAPMGAN